MRCLMTGLVFAAVTTRVLLAAPRANVLKMDFENSDLKPLQTFGGKWGINGGALHQSSEDSGRAAVLAQVTPWSTYRVSVRAKADRALGKGESFGLIAEAVDERTYYSFRLIQKKGGLFAELLRQDPVKITSVSDFLVGDLRPIETDVTKFHELRLDVDGVHVNAYLDGELMLTYSFAGRPSATYPHQPPWRQDIVAGVPGLLTDGVPATFDDFHADRIFDRDLMIAPLQPRRDASGMILPRRPYGQIVRDATDWFVRAKDVVEPPTDVPAIARDWDPITLSSYLFVNDDQRGVVDIQYPGHNHPGSVIGLVDAYLYSGDPRALAKARELADWNLRYAVPEGWFAAGLPLSHFDYKKLKPDGGYDPPADNFEPDKAANSGLAILRVYAVTGERKYLDRAVHVADVLLKLQFASGSFPYRINARTGEVIEKYTCSMIWYVQFFDLLHEFTHDEKYKQARDRAFAWLLNGPVKDNNWQGFYGDMPAGSPFESYDQWTALDAAMYLTDHREDDPTFVGKARNIVQYCIDKLVRYDGFHPGVPSLIEQTCYPAILTHHVVRLADAYARLYGASGDERDRRLAQEIANSVSWLQKSDGKFPHGLWFHAQANAYILNFSSIYIRLMAEMPETAAADENHLLRHDGQVREVKYEPQRIACRTWWPGRVLFKLAKAPREVRGAGASVTSRDDLKKLDTGWYWNARLGTLEILHGAEPIEIVQD